MSIPPSCRSVGPQCRALAVTLRVAGLEAGDPKSGDHEATWLLGHTERLRFGQLERRGTALFVDATIGIPCRYASVSGSEVQCQAHGFGGSVRMAGEAPQPRWQGPDEAILVEGGVPQTVRLPPARPPGPASLPVVQDNPCATARCRTADNRLGAACCRDLQLTILCDASDQALESLVRSRKPPLLCKVEREDETALGVEIISACGYLNDDAVCSLHGRDRPDGRSAKPDLCFDWPGAGDHYHSGCAFKPKIIDNAHSHNALHEV